MSRTRRDYRNLRRKLNRLEQELASHSEGADTTVRIADAKEAALSIRRALDLFEEGRDVEGAAATFAGMSALSTFFGSFSATTGPIGNLVGLAAGVIGAILEAIVGPKSESIRDQFMQLLTDEELKTRATDLHGEVGTLLDAQGNIGDWVKAREGDDTKTLGWDWLSGHLALSDRAKFIDNALQDLEGRAEANSPDWQYLLTVTVQLVYLFFCNLSALGGLLPPEDAPRLEKFRRRKAGEFLGHFAGIFLGAQNNVPFYYLDWNRRRIHTRNTGVGSWASPWNALPGTGNSFAVSSRATIFLTRDGAPFAGKGTSGDWRTPENAPRADAVFIGASPNERAAYVHRGVQSA